MDLIIPKALLIVPRHKGFRLTQAVEAGGLQTLFLFAIHDQQHPGELLATSERHFEHLCRQISVRRHQLLFLMDLHNEHWRAHISSLLTNTLPDRIGLSFVLDYYVSLDGTKLIPLSHEMKCLGRSIRLKESPASQACSACQSWHFHQSSPPQGCLIDPSPHPSLQMHHVYIFRTRFGDFGTKSRKVAFGNHTSEGFADKSRPTKRATMFWKCIVNTTLTKRGTRSLTLIVGMAHTCARMSTV